LEYKSPQLLREAVDEYVKGEGGKRGVVTDGWRVLDAGCGTGLSGVMFRNISGG